MKKLLLALLICSLLFSTIAEAGPKWKEAIEEKLERPILKTLFIAFVILNVILLAILLILYLNSFVKTKSSFTLGLVFFIGVLLIQKILSLIGLYIHALLVICLLYTSPRPRDLSTSRMPSSA